MPTVEDEAESVEVAELAEEDKTDQEGGGIAPPEDMLCRRHVNIAETNHGRL